VSEVTAVDGTYGARPGATGATDRGTGRSRRAVALLAVVGAVVVAVDMVTKLLAVELLAGRAPVELIPGVLDLRLTRNSGAAFSVAGGATVLLSIVALGVVLVIVRTVRRLRSPGWAVALGLILGGAVGNLTDRIFRSPGPLRGHVVDWIYLSHWPVFNVADSAITVGGVLAVVLSARGIGLDASRDRAGGGIAPAPAPEAGTPESGAGDLGRSGVR
jgi:signal peptidase II